MQTYYRQRIDKDIRCRDIPNTDLYVAVRQVAGVMIHDCLLFGKDIKYDEFIQKLQIYLDMVERIS